MAGIRIEIDGKWLNGFLAGTLVSASVYFMTQTESGVATRKLLKEVAKAGVRIASRKYREVVSGLAEKVSTI